MATNHLSMQALKQNIYTEKEVALLDLETIPEHIVIVMDGNRRWAKKRGLPVELGYSKGAKQLELIVKAAAEIGVKTLTAYSFSTENWNRSQLEIKIVIELLETYLKEKKTQLVQEGVRLSTIGDMSGLPFSLQQILHETTEATQFGDQIELVLALNYGGRDEIRRAFLRMVKAQQKGKLDWNEVTEQTIASYLDTASWKDPELFIRPSGEKRLSNFLIWQISYSELYVTDVLWPDFSPKNLLEAIIDFQKRNRRYGG